MANPRNVISFQGIGVRRVTYLVDGVTIVADRTKPFGSDQAGKNLAVSLSAHKTVQLASDGEAIIGRLEGVEPDGKAIIADVGYLEFKGGASATLTPGTAIVGALGASSAKGYIRSAASATAAELIKCRGQIIDASDTTSVVVRL